MSTHALIQNWAEQAVESIRSAKTETDPPLSDFEQGRYLGLGEALWLFQQQAIHVGLDGAELGLPSQDGISMAMDAILNQE